MVGWAIWITGLPGSGKSTIANELSKKLKKLSIPFQLLSIEMIRKVLTPNPSYTEEERKMVYAALVFIAELLTRNGVNVIIDATGNKRAYRDKARKRIKKFMEVYIKCPLKICMEREMHRKKTYGAPKGIYKKALTGKSLTVPGVGVVYEAPLKPEIIIDSVKLTPKSAAEKILNKIMEKWC
ncbi:MAG: adenylyl-sulfate kinase [Candidatus Bathyarchaeia archaeon]